MAILAPGRMGGGTSLSFDLTDQAAVGLVRRAGVSRSSGCPRTSRNGSRRRLHGTLQDSRVAFATPRPDQVVKLTTWVQLVTMTSQSQVTR